MFYVGQKVVCVDNKPHADGSIYDYQLKLKMIYTISAIIADDGHNNCGLVLSEIKSCHWSRAYKSSRFRPIVETKSEVSFVTGADPDSDKWDNRKVKVKQ